MADAAFNLSAEISLQLAKGAAASLRNQIQKGFQAPLELTGTDKAVKQARKDAASKPIAVPITFKVADRKTNIDAVNRAIGKIPVDVKFVAKQVKESLSRKNLLEILGKRKFYVEVEARFDKAAVRRLNSLQKTIDKLEKKALDLKGAVDSVGDVKVNTNQLEILGDEAQEATADVTNLIRRLQELTTVGAQQFKGGKFFEQAKSQISSLLIEMEKIGGSNALLLLEKKFEGLTGKSADNLTNSLRTVFKAFTDLEAQEKRINSAQASGSKRNFSAELQGIQTAREAISKLLLELDSADPQTFSTLVSSTMKEVSDATRKSLISSSRDVERFSLLLSNLNQKKVAAAGSGRAQTVGNIDALIKRAEDLNLKGFTVEQIKADSTYQTIAALVGELKYVDIAARRAQSSIENLLYKTKTGELGKSIGGRTVGFDSKVATIGAATKAKVAGEVDPKKVEQFRAEGARDIANLESRTEKLNGAFGRLFNQVAKFKADGFDEAAKSLQKFAGEVVRLDKLGVSIENIDRAVTSALARSLASKGLDAKVETSIRSIQRLRNALEFSPVDDIVGAKAALEKLDDNLKNRAGQFAGLTQNNLNSELSKGLFDVRGMQRFNEAAVNTVSKMQNISNGFEDLSKVSVYEGWITQFEAGAKRIAASSDSTGQKLQKLKILSDNVLVDAKLDSEGGFFGSIARSAGLATKRLAAFLVLAQGLYSIQGVLSASLTEAVKVDKEFTKLEQVLNKDFSGNKLEQNLSTLENQIKSLGKTLGVSTLEVANAAQILAQAGIYGKDLAVLLDTISKSQLGPSFGSASDTAEAAIAVFRQFNLTAEQTAAALGGINRLSAKYAVEAKGITEAVRRAGGVFSASGDEIEAFAAAFTLVKQKTREADEAIATGLRNIAQRLQTGSIQQKIKELLNVDLVENGEFIGFEKAIASIGKELDKVSTKSTKFAQVREAIAGARQGGRVSPLITDYKQFEELIGQFRKGARSIEEDVSVAFGSIENKITRAISAVTDLFHEIISSQLFKFLLEGFTQVVLAVTTMLKALNSIPGAILAVGVAANIFSKSKGPTQAFLSHFTRRPANPLPFNNGGPSGLIPGGGPNKDSILAYLTTGEYVLNRKSTKKYGTAFLDGLNDGAFPVNRGGIIPGYVGGSPGGVGSDLVRNIQGQIALKTKEVVSLGNSAPKELIAELASLRSALLEAVKAEKGLTSSVNESTKVYDTSKVNTGAGTNNAYALSDQTRGRITRYTGDPLSSGGDIAASSLYSNTKKATPVSSNATNSSKKGLVSSVDGFLKNLFKPSNIPIPQSIPKSSKDFQKGNAGGFDYDAPDGPVSGKSSALFQGAGNYGSVDFSKQLTKYDNLSKGAISAPKGPTGGLSSLSKAIPTGSLVAFGKSLVSSKQGLIGLGISAYSILAAFGGFESGLTKLVSAMAASAASMYALSNLTSVAGFANKQLGTGVKALQGAKARGIGETFKNKVFETKTSVPRYLKPIQRTSGLSLEGIASSNRNKAKISDLASGVRGEGSNIFKSIRGAAPAKGSFAAVAKSPVAVANLAAAKQMTGLTKILSKFTGGAAALSGKFTFGAVAVGAIIGALDFFVGSLEEAAIAGKESATTSKEYLAASAKGRLAETAKPIISGFSAVATGAATGATIGAFGGPVTAAIGGVVGGLIGFLKEFGSDLLGSLGESFPVIVEWGKKIKDGVSNFFSKLGDELFVTIENIKGGDLSDKISGISTLLKKSGPLGFLAGKGIDYFNTPKEKGKSFGEQKLGVLQQKDLLDFDVKKIGTDLAKDGKGQKDLTAKQLAQLRGKTNIGTGILNKAKELKGQKTTFKDLGADAQETISGEIQAVADVYKSSGPKNRKIILDYYKSNGEDFKVLAGELGVVIDEAGADMTAAFDELSVFFTKMKNVSELSSARISGLEGALQTFSDPSKISSDLPDQYFDILKQGIDPSTLGFGDTFKGGIEKTSRLANDLDPRLAANAAFEIKGRQAAKNTSDALIGSGLSIENPNSSSISNFVSSAFKKSSGGNAQLDEAFDIFLKSKGEEGTAKLVDGSGDINGAEINALFKEFADSLDTGALDQIQRLNSLSKQYVDQYKSHIAARFALENQAIDLLKENVGKRRSIGDVENKAKGLTGDKLAAARGKQAATADKDRLGLTLSGTGFGAGSSVAQLQAGLLASQQRGRSAAADAAAQLGPGAKQADIDSRRAQIEGGEEEQQNRLRAALQLVASGTDTAAQNMEEFERALEKAANSSKFMTDALLGSDEQMNNTVLGLQAFAKVQEAFKQGGVGAAQQVVATLGEDARQALGSTVGQNADNQAIFNQAVGISSDISGGKEAAKVTADTTAQIEANNALVAGLQDNAKQMAENTASMQAIYETQFKNTQQIVQQAEATSKALVEQIASIPGVIKHEGNIVVKIEGAAGLIEMEKGIQGIVSNMVKLELDKFGNKLVENNNGLNRP